MVEPVEGIYITKNKSSVMDIDDDNIILLNLYMDISNLYEKT